MTLENLASSTTRMLSWGLGMASSMSWRGTSCHSVGAGAETSKRYNDRAFLTVKTRALGSCGPSRNIVEESHALVRRGVRTGQARSHQRDRQRDQGTGSTLRPARQRQLRAEGDR